MKHQVTIRLNGDLETVEVASEQTLLDTLRNRFKLFGAREACGVGVCGACTVLVEGRPVSSCVMLAALADGKEILTIEGLGNSDNLHPLQKSFALSYAAQCGWCTPGMIMSAKALLNRNPNPTEAEVRAALAGVLCRCTGYTSIVKAVLDAASVMRGAP